MTKASKMYKRNGEFRSPLQSQHSDHVFFQNLWYLKTLPSKIMDYYLSSQYQENVTKQGKNAHTSFRKFKIGDNLGSETKNNTW